MIAYLLTDPLLALKEIPPINEMGIPSETQMQARLQEI